MASTITLAKTIAWAKSFIANLDPTIQTGSEPALTSANIIRQTILGPPFVWRWNRATVSLTAAQGTQDYTQAVASFNFIETASVQDIGVTPNRWFELSPNLCLGLASEQGRPRDLAVQTDDGAGNLTFRLLPVPDKAYPVTVTVQKNASLFAATTDTWGPIPDEYSYIYNWGFLALMYMYNDDPRFTVANQKFIAALLGAQQGLSETERNIFLNNWEAISGQQAQNAMKMQQGNQARGV